MIQRNFDVSTAEFVKDFFAGTTDEGLARKYRLSASELREVFRSLLDARTITSMEFESWQIFHNISIPLRIRLYPRTTLTVPHPIHEAANPDNRGLIINCSEYGIGVRGLRCQVDRVMNLVIPPNSIPRSRPATIQARCKWIACTEGCDEPESGFYVVVVNEMSWDLVRHGLTATGRARGA